MQGTAVTCLHVNTSRREVYFSHLLVKLHQTPFAGISVLFIIKIFIVVHVPAHLLLIFNRALRGIELQRFICLPVLRLCYDLDTNAHHPKLCLIREYLNIYTVICCLTVSCCIIHLKQNYKDSLMDKFHNMIHISIFGSQL